MKQAFSYQETGRALSSVRGNRVRLALAFSVLFFSVLLPFVVALRIYGLVFGTGEALSESEMLLSDFVFYGLWLILGLLLIPPVLALFYRYAYRLYCESKDAAGYGGDRSFGKPLEAWRFGFLLILRPLGCGALIWFVLWISQFFRYCLHFPLLALAVLLCVVWMRCGASWFLIPYRMCLGDDVRVAVRNSRKQMVGRKKLYGKYISAFLFHGILSVLTVGVWLVFYMLPNLIFTYFTLAESLDSKENS